MKQIYHYKKLFHFKQCCSKSHYVVINLMPQFHFNPHAASIKIKYNRILELNKCLQNGGKIGQRINCNLVLIFKVRFW